MAQRRSASRRSHISYNRSRHQKGKREIRTKSGRGVRFSPIGCVIRIIIVLVFVLAVFFFFKSNLFAVDSIKVEGLVHIGQEEIVNLSGLQLGENIFEADCRAAEEQIALHAALTDINVHRKFPKSLVIEVRERQGTATTIYDGTHFILDGEGYIISKFAAYNKSLPVIIGLDEDQVLSIGMRLDSPRIVSGLTLAAAMSGKYPDTKKEILAETPNNIICYFNGREVRFGDSTDLDKKLLVMEDVFDAVPSGGWAKLEYLDVSDPQNPIIKYSDEDAARSPNAAPAPTPTPTPDATDGTDATDTPAATDATDGTDAADTTDGADTTNAADPAG